MQSLKGIPLSIPKARFCCNPVRGYSPYPFNFFFARVHFWAYIHQTISPEAISCIFHFPHFSSSIHHLTWTSSRTLVNHQEMYHLTLTRTFLTLREQMNGKSLLMNLLEFVHQESSESIWCFQNAQLSGRSFISVIFLLTNSQNVQLNRFDTRML